MTTSHAEPRPLSAAPATLPVLPADGLRAFALPISRNQEATLYVPKSLDERGWDRMMRVLDAMKEGILSDEDDDPGESEAHAGSID